MRQQAQPASTVRHSRRWAVQIPQGLRLLTQAPQYWWELASVGVAWKACTHIRHGGASLPAL